MTAAKESSDQSTDIDHRREKVRGVSYSESPSQSISPPWWSSFRDLGNSSKLWLTWQQREPTQKPLMLHLSLDSSGGRRLYNPKDLIKDSSDPGRNHCGTFSSSFISLIHWIILHLHWCLTTGRLLVQWNRRASQSGQPGGSQGSTVTEGNKTSHHSDDWKRSYTKLCKMIAFCQS